MNAPELFVFAGLAALYASGIAFTVHAGLRLARGIWVAQAFPAVFLTAFFLALTHHPFPEIGSLDCSNGGEHPLFVPFQFIQAASRLWRNDATLGMWLLDLSVASAVMNLVICTMIGAALAPLLHHTGAVLVFASSLTGFVEISQFTGIFNIYECPYRQFDVDDLILNIVGVLLGWNIGTRLTSTR